VTNKEWRPILRRLKMVLDGIRRWVCTYVIFSRYAIGHNIEMLVKHKISKIDKNRHNKMQSIKVALDSSRSLHALYKAATKQTNCSIILIHGADRKFQNAKHWTQHYDTFVKHGSVYALDMLGHGESQPGENDNSIDKVSPDEQVQAIKSLIQQEKKKNNIDKFVLVGRSYGGSIVLRVAKELPDLIDRLILISPAAGKDLVHQVSQTVPVMLVWAKDDPIVSSSNASAFTDYFKQCKPLIFEQVVTDQMREKKETWRAHSSENERPEEFHKAVDEFLS
jgi:pimeloyl-ACP methyl ester carboxylesterase